MLYLDAIREMRKYDVNHDGKGKEQQHQHLEQELRNSMVLFRAQRNFYITGFSLFLILYVAFILPRISRITLSMYSIHSSVIRRLMTLLAAQATLDASSQAALRQAASASKAAEQLMAKNDGTESNANLKKSEETIARLKEELEEAKKGETVLFKCKVFCLVLLTRFSRSVDGVEGPRGP